MTPALATTLTAVALTSLPAAPVLGELEANNMMFLASLVAGLSVGVLAFSLLQVMWRDTSLDAELREDERQRRVKLRQGSDMYRLFEPLVDELGPFVTPNSPMMLERLRLDLSFAEPLPFRPVDYLGLAAVKGFITSICVLGLTLVLGMNLFFVLLLSVGSGFGLYFVEANRVTEQANRKRLKFKRRLPFAVDLMASMLSAGAVFVETLRTVTRENAGHPLGEEFGRVLQETEMGRPRKEALESLDRRVSDPDLSELIFAVNKGEELGTKLSDIFANMAEQMRLKRSQWAEKAAGNAQVMIAFPGLITMLACMLVVVSPFVLKAMREFALTPAL